MNHKTVIGLGVAAALALVAAFVLSRSSQPRSESDRGMSKLLAPELRDHVNDIDTLVVTGAGNIALATLVRSANGWSVSEKGGYAADTGKLRALLLKLADATLVEQKTLNKEKYALLGVEDVALKDAKGLQLDLGGLAEPLKIIVGNSNPRGGGSFVRRVGDAQSWLVSSPLSVERNAVDWLNRDLADIPPSRIQSVSVTHADGKLVRATKDAESDANFRLAGIPAGREAASEFSINALASLLDNLRFDDVLPTKETVAGDQPLTARYVTFDGVVVEVTAWQTQGKDYARLSATLDAAQAESGIAAAQGQAKAQAGSVATASAPAGEAAQARDATVKPAGTPAESDPVKDRDSQLAALTREVARLNARFNDWTFVVPAHKYATIDKSLDDLLQPLADGKKAAPNKGR